MANSDRDANGRCVDCRGLQDGICIVCPLVPATAEPAPQLPPAFYAARVTYTAADGHKHRWVTEVEVSAGGLWHPRETLMLAGDAAVVFCAYPGCKARP